MNQVSVKYFNKPMLLINGEKAPMTLKKSEIILYYMLIEKRATRTELSSLFWEGIDEKSAKKNLRNSLYRIKQDIGFEILFCPNKTQVELHPDINVISDYDDFFKDKENNSLYDGHFMKDMYIKNSESFDKWMRYQREKINQVFINRSHEMLQGISFDHISHEALTEAKMTAEQLLGVDEFDELAVQYMMRIYYQEKNYKKIVEEYKRIKYLLDEEMGVEPDPETTHVYYQLLNKRIDETEIKTEIKKKNIIGREKDIRELEKMINQWVNGQVNHFLIMGEAGVGKTKLLDSIKEKFEECIIVSVNCYQMQQDYKYKIWDDIFGEISKMYETGDIEITETSVHVLNKVFPSFNQGVLSEHVFLENIESIKNDYIERIVLKVFENLTKNKHIVIMIDDLQWIDEESLKILKSLILSRNKHLMFCGTMRNEIQESLEAFVLVMRRYNLLSAYMLKRLDVRQTKAFIKTYLKEPMSDEDMIKIYDETEGNIFFIVEYLNAFKINGLTDIKENGKIQDILASRLIGLSGESRQILDIASLFYDALDYDMLTKILTKDEFEIIDALKVLVDKYLIEEFIVGDEIKYKFTHNKLREFIYRQIQTPKRRVLHNRMAKVYEKELTGQDKDVLIYQKLLYHYKLSGNKEKYLTYYLKYAESYFDFSHELYPEISSIQSSAISNKGIDKDIDAQSYFNEIQTIIEDFQFLSKDAQYIRASYCHLYGRYLIREGQYKEGSAYIKELIDLADALQKPELLIKGYKQMIYYGIQSDHVALIKKYVGKGMALIERENMAKNRAIFLRLEGLYEMKKGDYTLAKIRFEESIVAFERLNKPSEYSLNIAACYNYISEIKKMDGDLKGAILEVEKAIELCNALKIIRGLSVFNTNAGMIAYEMGLYEKAEQYFDTALTMYKKIGTHWKYSTALAYKMLILSMKTPLENHIVEDIKKGLAEAKMVAIRLGNPQEEKLLASISKEVNNNIDVFIDDNKTNQI